MDKNKTPQGSYIDLFRFNGHNCCPIAALQNLHQFCKNEKEPVFKFANGRLLNPRVLNNTIQCLLSEVIGPTANLISGHSFRAALPSAMANDPVATKDVDIKNWGRWSSESYLVYTRLKFRQKKLLFDKIVNVLNKS
jgi:hypothetical protein